MNDGGVCRTAPATPGLLNILGINKVKGQHVKIPPTKHDIPQAKYDVPLPFNKMNSTGQHIMSCNTVTSVRLKGTEHIL